MLLQTLSTYLKGEFTASYEMKTAKDLEGIPELRGLFIESEEAPG